MKMWNEPTLEGLAELPKLYETESVPEKDKLIYMHFFLGGCDWYAAEYGPTDRIFFGYAILNNDLQNAEWGYTSFDELRSINVRGFEIDRESNWQPTKVSDIEKIMAAYESQGRSM